MMIGRTHAEPYILARVAEANGVPVVENRLWPK